MKDGALMSGQSVIDIISERTSVRTYAATPIDKEKRDAMAAFLAEHTDNPFGAHVRFSLIDSEDAPKKLGTYGFIKGAKTFFAGCAQEGERDMEGFGFAFEKAVLYAKALGLGTCWLGGTFKRGAFSKIMQPAENEILPAATPVGYAAKKKSWVERNVEKSAAGRTRKPFEMLFFDGSFEAPLTIDGDIKTCLEMVRIAPSASNKQPWRIVKIGDAFAFYMQKEKNYVGNTAFGFCMQRIDMGIAACHFMLSAHELGLNTQVSYSDPQLTSPAQAESGLEYIFTCSVNK